MSGVILTSYFSKKKHPNALSDAHVIGRQADGYVKSNDISYIKKWYDSINSLSLNGVIFHDNLSEEFVDEYTTESVSFVGVGDSPYSNNDYRFFCFRDYLAGNEFDWVFHADVSDVVIVKNPANLISAHSDYKLFACSNAPYKLHEFGDFLAFHKLMKWDNYFDFVVSPEWDLINMGVVGGRYEDMLDFYKSFCEVREECTQNLALYPHCGPYFNSNMWICQYLFRSVFADYPALIGEPVTSEFKKYQNDREDVWFIHK